MEGCRPVIAGTDTQGADVFQTRGLVQAVQPDIAEYVVVEFVGEPVPLRTAGRNVGVHAADVQPAGPVLEITERGRRRMAGNLARQGDVQQAVDNLSKVNDPGSFTRRFDRHGRDRFDDDGRLAGLRRCGQAGYLYHIHRAPVRVDPGIDGFPAEPVGSPCTGLPVAAPGAVPGRIRADQHRTVQIQFRPYQRTGIPCAEGIGPVPARTGMDDQFVPALLQQIRNIVRDDQRAFVKLGNGRRKDGIGNFPAVEPGLMVAQGIDMQQGLARAVQGENLAQQCRAAVARHSPDEVAPHGIRCEDADSEALRTAPFRRLARGVPDAHPPPGLHSG